MSYAPASPRSTGRTNRYREMEILSATPGELVLVVYDHLLASLQRARMAATGGHRELRGAEIARARDAVVELLATLDHAKGAEVAAQLSALYGFFLRELTTLAVEQDADRLARLTGMVRELRDAFATIEHGAH